MTRRKKIGGWPETNRLPDISPARMALLWIRKELQFRSSTLVDTCRDPQTAGKENILWEKGSWRTRLNKGSMAFHWMSFCCHERKSVFFLLGFAINYLRAWGFPSGLPTLFNWGFHLLVLHFPLLSISVSESISDLDRFFQFQGFLSLSVRKDLSWVYCLTLKVKCTTGNFLRSHSGNK